MWGRPEYRPDGIPIFLQFGALRPGAFPMADLIALSGTGHLEAVLDGLRHRGNGGRACLNTATENTATE